MTHRLPADPFKGSRAGQILSTSLVLNRCDRPLACQADTGVVPPSRLGGDGDHDADVAEMGVGPGSVWWAVRPLVLSDRDASFMGREPCGPCVGEGVGAGSWGRRGSWQGLSAAAIAVYYEFVYRSLVSLEAPSWNTNGVLAMPICGTARARFRSAACHIGCTARAHLKVGRPQGYPQPEGRSSTTARGGRVAVRRMPNSHLQDRARSSPRLAEPPPKLGTRRTTSAADGHAAYDLPAALAVRSPSGWTGPCPEIGHPPYAVELQAYAACPGCGSSEPLLHSRTYVPAHVLHEGRCP